MQLCEHDSVRRFLLMMGCDSAGSICGVGARGEGDRGRSDAPLLRHCLLYYMEAARARSSGTLPLPMCMHSCPQVKKPKTKNKSALLSAPASRNITHKVSDRLKVRYNQTRG